MKSFILSVVLVAPLAHALTVPTTALTPASTVKQPTITLSQGTYQGSTANGIDAYLGLPFAKDPVGPLRFSSPAPLAPATNAVPIPATSYGLACYQQSATSGTGGGDAAITQNNLMASPFIQSAQPATAGEACLNLNVLAPTGAQGLPVIVWIYGGGFEFGSAGSGNNGTTIVARSIAQKTPVIYVNANYRLNGFGFMPGNEIDAAGAGNLGLQDQRATLVWVQQNIAKFGGDPSKVTIWGESAGAISVALQMVHAGKKNNGNLFRAAYSQSGAPIPMGLITSPASQAIYDNIVSIVGCTGKPSTLDCLRGVPYLTLANAIETTQGILTYQSLALVWRPRMDSVFLPKNPFLDAVPTGDFAQVPYINGDCDDEGTFFAAAISNVTTESQFRAYIKEFYVPGSSDPAVNADQDADIASLAELYPSDPVVGSPFDTGFLNTITPQFKRLSSILGDIVFQGPRRHFFQSYVGTAPLWSYNYKKGKNNPALGAYHGSDIAEYFASSSNKNQFITPQNFQLIDYLVNFAVNLNPNPAIASGSLLYWPNYTLDAPSMLTFLDAPSGGLNGLAITLDNYRIDALAGLTKFTQKYGATQ